MLAVTLALVLGRDDPESARVSGVCRAAGTKPPFPAPGSRHPAQTFYTPRDEVPRDLTHGITHGYVVVTYDPGLPQSEQDALAEWAVSADFVVVAPAENQDEAVRAVTARRTLGCTQVDLDSLTQFRDGWFDATDGGRRRSPPRRG